jgi:hypothetical protein
MISMNSKENASELMRMKMPNRHSEVSDLLKLRGPTIGTKLLLKRVCPTLRVIILLAELSNPTLGVVILLAELSNPTLRVIILLAKLSDPIICSIVHWARSQSTLGLIPVLLHLWIRPMQGIFRSITIVNIKRMQQCVYLMQ